MAPDKINSFLFLIRKDELIVKKIIAIVILISLFLNVSSFADGAYNLEKYSSTELEAIYSMASNEAFGCVKVPTGLYIVGKDLPSGIYTVLKNSDTPGNTQDDFSHVAIFNSIDDYKKDPNNIFNEGSYAIASCNTMWNGLSCELNDGMVLVVYLGLAGITKADDNLFSIIWDSEANQENEKTNNASLLSDYGEPVNTEKMYAFLKKSLSNGEVKLKHFDWPEITVDQFLLSNTYIGKRNYTKEEALYTLQKELPNASTDFFSLSPSGNSGLLKMNGGTVSYYNGRYTFTYPTDTRAYKIDDDKQRYYYGIIDNLRNNCVIYSHNGRYASVFSFELNSSSSSLMRKPEPTLIDLKTGEIIALGIFADVQEVADPGYITTGCFSLDDKYFYYNIIRVGKETSTNTLYRYCIETDTSEECCFIPLMLVTADMYETADNHLISIGLNNDRNTERLNISQINGNWVASTEPLSLKFNHGLMSDFQYSSKTGLGLITFSRSFRSIWFMELFDRIVAEENEPIVGIVNNNNEFMVMTDDVFATQIDIDKGKFTDFGGIQVIRDCILSPDGHFALLLVGNKRLELILVDLETKETCIISGIKETMKVAPLGPSIEWNSDKLIVFTDQNEHQMYQFDF